MRWGMHVNGWGTSKGALSLAPSVLVDGSRFCSPPHPGLTTHSEARRTGDGSWVGLAKGSQAELGQQNGGMRRAAQTSRTATRGAVHSNPWSSLSKLQTVGASADPKYRGPPGSAQDVGPGHPGCAMMREAGTGPKSQAMF